MEYVSYDKRLAFAICVTLAFVGIVLALKFRRRYQMQQAMSLPSS